MRLGHLMAGSALLAAVAGCKGEEITIATEMRSATALNRVVSHASGEGSAQLPPGFSTLTFAFSARRKEDGSAAGSFTQRFESASGIVDFDGDVTCLAVDPVNHRTWVGGVITRNGSTNPGRLTPIHEVGRDVWFRVVDNGEGPNAPDDRTTVFGFQGGGGIVTSAQYCATMPWTAGDVNTWGVFDGNIQVGR